MIGLGLGWSPANQPESVHIHLILSGGWLCKFTSTIDSMLPGLMNLKSDRVTQPFL